MWKPLFTPDLVVADVLKKWPQTIPVFLDHNLGCVGCAMASFDTLRDVARIYNLRADLFLEELGKAVENDQPTPS
jgi:hybrid cluster-associated redox disulfide protein